MKMRPWFKATLVLVVIGVVLYFIIPWWFFGPKGLYLFVFGHFILILLVVLYVFLINEVFKGDE